jgi:hypothetical protein
MTDAEALQAVQDYLDHFDETQAPRPAIARLLTLATASIALAGTLEERNREIEELRRLIDPMMYGDLSQMKKG